MPAQTRSQSKRNAQGTVLASSKKPIHSNKPQLLRTQNRPQTRSMTIAKVEVSPQSLRRQTRAYAKSLESQGIKSDVTRLEFYASECAEFNKRHSKCN